MRTDTANLPDWAADTPPSVAGYLDLTSSPFPLLAVAAALLAALYLAGAVRLWSTGRRWSVIRTIVFLIGCALVVAVTATQVEDYSYRLVSVFMFQQLTLMMAAPPLLVLGAPGTLLLRATPHKSLGRPVLRAALAALRSRAARLLLHPGVTVPLFLLMFYGLYLARGADLVLAAPAGHTVLQVLFLAAGILFTVPILSPDPYPGRHSALGRLVETFAKTALHTFFGIIVMLSPAVLLTAFTAPSEWGVDPLHDQAIAGALVWTYAELPSVVILIHLLNRWHRDSTRRDRDDDRRADAAGDPDLASYNDYLATLSRRSTPRPPA